MDKRVKRISRNVIRRLPRYYSHLFELKENDVDKVSSKELSEITGFTASQIRQDLNNFGGFGKQGSGYEVGNLYKEIGEILGVNQVYNTVIVGAGNLGQAIANYPHFKEYGLNVKAMFDVNPKIVGNNINNLEVLDVDNLKEFIEKENIDIVIICTPKKAVDKISDILNETNIKGVWNFAQASLNLKSDIKVETVHLSDSLLVLSYMINKKIF